MKIEVVTYNSDWPKMFESEKTIISNALGDNCVAIHHIGSTSVSGLAAKPKIDIIAVVKDRKSAIENLEKAGYKYKGEWNIPLQCGFSKRDGVAVNLHMFFDQDHPEIELNLCFRDYLRTHPDVRDEYAAIKMKILQDDSAHKKVGKLSFPVYTIRKRKFIDDIIEKIGFNRLRILKCLTDDEWSTAKSIRQKYFFDKQKIQDPYLQDFEDPNHEHLLLYNKTKIIGYADIRLWPESKIAALRVIAIVDSYQNNDFGSFFLTIIEKWLETLDYGILYVKSNSHFFYPWNGYQEMPFDDPDEYKNCEFEPIGETITYLWHTPIRKIFSDLYHKTIEEILRESCCNHHCRPVGKYLKTQHNLMTHTIVNDLIKSEIKLRNLKMK